MRIRGTGAEGTNRRPNNMEIIYNMEDQNPIMSTLTLNVNGLNTLIKSTDCQTA